MILILLDPVQIPGILPLECKVHLSRLREAWCCVKRTSILHLLLAVWPLRCPNTLKSMFGPHAESSPGVIAATSVARFLKPRGWPRPLSTNSHCPRTPGLLLFVGKREGNGGGRGCSLQVRMSSGISGCTQTLGSGQLVMFSEKHFLQGLPESHSCPDVPQGPRLSSPLLQV